MAATGTRKYLTQLLLPLPGGRAGYASRKAYLSIRDRVIVIEVMTKKREFAWWRRYRKALEARLGQDEIVARTGEISMN